MQRFRQLLFAISLLLCSWYGMLAVHECGHVLGAVSTGGCVTRMVLHPGVISRTDVEPNPHPGVVAWSGPIVGCVFPACLAAVIPRRWANLRQIAAFLAGFCLIANGAYIGAGAWLAVGDCREMLHTGTPPWAMATFGIVAGLCGLLIWHRLGSPREFLRDPSRVRPVWAYTLFVMLIVYAIAARLLSPQ